MEACPPSLFRENKLPSNRFGGGGPLDCFRGFGDDLFGQQTARCVFLTTYDFVLWVWMASHCSVPFPTVTTEAVPARYSTRSHYHNI